MNSKVQELRKLAEKALNKPSQYGIDLELSKFNFGDVGPIENVKLDELPSSILTQSSKIGIDVSERNVSGTYFQIDHSVLRTYVIEKLKKYGVIVMSTLEALQKYDWAREYYWKAIPVDLDKYTAVAEIYARHGYFIYVPPGVKVKEPIQACLFISKRGVAQPVHNIVIVDEGAELNLVTGCTTIVEEGIHIGISEFYVKKNAKLTFTMIHGWSQGFDSRPRSAAIIGENGAFISNYLLFTPVRSLQMYPVAYCSGENSKVRFNSILYGSKDSHIDVGSKIVLQNDGTRGEIITRAVATDNSKIYMRGFLEGRCEDCRAHLECRGLLLSDKAIIHAVPELLAKAPGADLSHEAAVGKIAEEEIHYLMARGFSEREAVSLIVRGFMDVRTFDLPAEIEKRMKRIIKVISKRSL